MNVRMMRHRTAPGVEHRRDADLRAKMFGVASDRDHRLGGGLHEQIIDDALVLIGNIGNRRRQREHDMEVADRKQFSFPGFTWMMPANAATLRTVPIAARVIGNVCLAARAVLTLCNMAAERCCAAAFDRAHHLHLVETDVTTVGLTPAGTVIAENIRDLQRWARHSLVRLSPASLALWLATQIIEWAFDGGDHACRIACVARGRLQLVVTEQGLNGADINAAIE